MAKWKKINKKLVVVLLATIMVIGSQTTAFAYVDQGTETEQTKTEADRKTEIKTENVLEDEHADETGESFSVPGNAEVLDDISDDSSKEFLTVTTKNNNTFYIVIDRSAASENVYMLSQVDENDLTDFLTESPEEETSPSVVLDDVHTEEDTTETVVTEPVEEQETAGTNAGLLSILAIAGVGVAAYYYFKIYKKKQIEDDTPDEGIETGDGLDTINEDEEAKEKTESKE